MNQYPAFDCVNARIRIAWRCFRYVEVAIVDNGTAVLSVGDKDDASNSRQQDVDTNPAWLVEQSIVNGNVGIENEMCR